MYRSQYDYDITIWSPQGRIHQIEYAMEAVKQGSACVGLKSKNYVVLATLKRSSSQLGAYQQKTFKIDEHLGIAISGLTADARLLSKMMRTEALNHKFTYEEPIPTVRLVSTISDKSQVHTQKYGRRPYGVGLLVAGYDETGAHLFETSPSGNHYDWKAHAIGSRSQSARTYLEKNFPNFENLNLNDLIKHALTALRETLQSSSEGLTSQNCSVGIVGKDQTFEILEDDKLAPFLSQLDEQSQKMETEEKKQ